MCCLKNEQETYEYLNSRLPFVGDTVTTPSGMRGEVTGINVLRQLVKVVVDNGEEKELQEYSVDDLRFTPRRRKDVKLTEEELKELEGLEDSGEIAGEKPERESRRDNNRQQREHRSDRDNQGRNNRGDRDNPKDYNRGERSNERRDYNRKNGRGRRNYNKNNQDGSNRGEQGSNSNTQS